MKQSKTVKQTTLEDLEKIFSLTMAQENFTIALKAKELIGRAQGLFSLKSPSKKDKITLDGLSDEELSQLVGEIELKLNLESKDKNE